MTPEQKLAALFAAGAPARRDYAFEADVAERIARRRAWMTVAAMLPWAVVAGLVLWALQPVLETVSGQLAPMIEPVALVGVGAVVAGGVAVWLTGRLQRRVTVATTPK